MRTEDIKTAIDLRLALLGLPRPHATLSSGVAEPLLARQRELRRRTSEKLNPTDSRAQAFLDDFLADVGGAARLPATTMVLDQPGLARALSLPHDGAEFHSTLVDSYRVAQGVLHNPRNDRRTTKGAFHVAEGGLAIPDDKIAVAKAVYARLLAAALTPPEEALRLPWTANESEPAATFVSLYLRPLVRPEVPGHTIARTLETRFVVPGGLVCNLDFAEGIFGNAGDALLPENDAALDPAWTGQTGYVLLAPHLIELTKSELGLPHIDDATERQRRDGQCWSDPAEKYNDGNAFKITARDARGVMVTIIADNYFGYCKKEVKTQISYAANLLGAAEEEHAGGAICYPAWNLADRWEDETPAEFSLADVVARDPERFEMQPEGHAIDREIEGVVLVPGDAKFALADRTVTWDDGSIPLEQDVTYLSPNGYRVLAKHREADPTQWHLVGVSPTATHCHKPATVSGGGKSEISKSIVNAFVYGNAYSPDFDADMDHVQRLLDRDYSDRYADGHVDDRPILAPERSLGSVIKLLTPSDEYHESYNEFLASVPHHVKELLFLLKRHYRPEWAAEGASWRDHFSVGIMNGRTGVMVRLDGAKIIVNMVRVGFDADGNWRLFSLRPDFSPAVKVQTEDDITASTVVRDPGSDISVKYVENCERLLFQRPDDAIYRGFDRQAEADLASDDLFISNFEPMTREEARELRADMAGFSQYTPAMRDRIAGVADGDDEWFVSSAHPRLVNGQRSKNPRYLQVRPDVSDPRATAIADLARHLVHQRPLSEPLPAPVDVVAAGRRNNPPDDGVPALCSYNPLHYMELPELFMEYISSMTGKSPSTTGAGSEGAMTKGPFNAIPAIYDLNAALLSYALTNGDGWLSGAGWIGPHVRMDHDFSMLVPEVFSRMTPAERDAGTLIADGYLERIPDMEVAGRTVASSRLGYRINARFARRFFGRIFLHPDVVFPAEILQPELQDPEIFADSVDVIVTTHERVARAYQSDGTIQWACPPLRGLLEIMADGATVEGWTLGSPEFRSQFSRDAIVGSDWYAARIDAQQAADVARCERLIRDLESWVEHPESASEAERLGLADRLAAARDRLQTLRSDAHRESLIGTTGREPQV